jgi:hypothetical protein
MQFNIEVKKPNYNAQLIRKTIVNDFYAGEKKTINL